MPSPPPMRIGGVLLAGGQSRRMGGADKCLLSLGGLPLLEHARRRLQPQTARLAINANAEPARFAAFALPVLADEVEGFAGPLAGALAGMRWGQKLHPPLTHIVTAPGDGPFLPSDLVVRLQAAAARADTPLACAASGGRAHPVFGLWPTALADDLEHALRHEGVRKIAVWSARHGVAEAEYPAAPFDPFFNINREEDMREAEAILAASASASAGRESPQVVAVVGWKNSGKTGLVVRLVAALAERGLRVSTAKHVHHDIDLEQPGRDTWRHRQAGAREVALASESRVILQEELRAASMPSLAELAARMRPTDLVIAEGFKSESVPKLEAWRPACGQAPIAESDPRIFAVAAEGGSAALKQSRPRFPRRLPIVELDDTDAILSLIREHLRLP